VGVAQGDQGEGGLRSGPGNGPGSGAGSGQGRGPGRGPKGEYNPDDPSAPSKPKSKLSPGKILSSIQFKTMPQKGELHSQYSDVHGQAASEAAAALQQQEVPPSYRAHVRDYFDAIRPDKK
jgi:hypothetical protein